MTALSVLAAEMSLLDSHLSALLRQTGTAFRAALPGFCQS